MVAWLNGLDGSTTLKHYLYGLMKRMRGWVKKKGSNSDDLFGCLCLNF